jgi:hypothetical protein
MMTPSVSPKWDQNRSAPHASPPARCSSSAARGHVVPSSIATASGGPTTASTCRSAASGSRAVVTVTSVYGVELVTPSAIA